MFRAANCYRIYSEDIHQDTLDKYYAIFNSYLGLLRATQGYKLRKKLCNKVAYPFFIGAEDCKKIVKCYFPENLVYYVDNPAKKVLKEFYKLEDFERQRMFKEKNDKKLKQIIANNIRIRKEAEERWGKETVVEFLNNAFKNPKIQEKVFEQLKLNFTPFDNN